MTTTNSQAMTTKLTDYQLTVAASHGEREGRKDYLGRAQDVARGAEEPEWAWPYSGADEAYINAVGTGEICRSIGIDPSAWDQISEAWCVAFTSGYRNAHAATQASDAS